MKKLFQSIIYLLVLILPLSINLYGNDTNAFQLDRTHDYFTKNHPKAKGLNISLEYPVSWLTKEGKRPNIVQKFIKPSSDTYMVMCIIMIKGLPYQFESFSEEQIAQALFSKESFKSSLPKNSTLIRYKQTCYDGQPGYIGSFKTIRKRSGFQILVYFLNHVFIYSKKIIIVQCQVLGSPLDREEVSRIYKNYLPLFMQIGNSIVIHDKWNK